MLVILSAALLLLQLILVLLLGGLSSQIRDWTGRLAQGYSAEILEQIQVKLPDIALELRHAIVDWNGVAHLKSPSSVIVTHDRIQQSSGLTVSHLSGLSLMIFVVAVIEGVTNSSTDTWVLPALVGMSLLSIILTGYVTQNLNRTIGRFRFVLDQVCPPIPSSDSVTRDVMAQLQQQMTDFQVGQQASLTSLNASQQTLVDLGAGLQQSFQQSVQAALAPTLESITTIASGSQQANQRFVEETTRKQNQVVQTLITQVMTGIDEAIGQSLRDTSESFATSVQRQQVSMDRWRRSVESVADVIQSLETTTRGVTLGAERMAQAAEPVQAAALVFSESAQQLQNVFPVVSQLGDMVLQAQSGLTESHAAIQQGTQEYLEVTGTIRNLVQELNQAHEMAISRIARGVEDSLVKPFGDMSTNMQTLQTAQSTAFEQLQSMNQTIEQTLTHLESGHQNIAELAGHIERAGEPNIRAAEALVQVTQQLESIVPQLEQSSQIHQSGAETLQRISGALETENNRNIEVLERVQQLVTHLDSTQQQMADRVAHGVDEALADKLVEAKDSFVEHIAYAGNALRESGTAVAANLQSTGSLVAGTLEASGEELANVLKQTGEAQTLHWSQSTTEMVSKLQTATDSLTNKLETSGEHFANVLQTSGTEHSQMWSDNTTEMVSKLQTATDSLTTQLTTSSQHLGDTIRKSGTDLNLSLEDARQKLAETMTASTVTLTDGLSQAAQQLVGDWGTLGQSIQDAMEHASQSLDQSVQEVGRKLNLRIEEAGQSLEQSVQLSATSLEQSVQASAASLAQGAGHAHDKLSQVGDGWSTAIQSASTSLTDSASVLNAGVRETLESVQQELSAHVERTLTQLESTMVTRLNEGVQAQQQLIQSATTQQTQSSQHLLNSTNEAVQMLHSNLHATQDALQARLVDFGTDLQVSLQEIFQQYQSSMSLAARQQSMAGQSLVDQAQQAGETLQQSMQEAQINTRQVLEQISGDMVLQLGHVHQQYSTTLEQSQQSMARLVTLQEGHIGSWKELVQTLTPALSQLNQSAGQLDQVIQTLQASMVPATTVSENFVTASTQLQAVFPNIAETADAYHRFNQSLQSASSTLSDTAEKYIRAGSGMGGLLGQIEQSLDLQNQSNTAVSSTLGGVQHTIQNLEPIVRLMQQASEDMRAVSEGSTSTIDTMKQATESQQNSVNQMGELSQQLLTTLSGQSGRLIELTNQMEQLQQVLTVGVDAFAQTLPRSVDGTLVQFDAVLAEGVLRINGSIERLREAMDDLIEQLER